MTNISYHRSHEELQSALHTPTLNIILFTFVYGGKPCKKAQETFIELSQQYGDLINFGVIDSEEFPDAFKQFDVQALPTMIIFKNGDAVETLIGVQSKETLERLFDRYR
jgi:thioredoxin 1